MENIIYERDYTQEVKLYQNGLMSKDAAYRWLAGILQAPQSEAHIGYLGDYYCKLVIDESKKVLEQHRARGNICQSK